MNKQIKIKHADKSIVQRICDQTGLHPVTAAILANRNLTTKKLISAFLNPSLNDIQSFETLTDIKPAVLRISDAITNHEKILIFGDYDVDGITSTTVLYEFLNYAGADVSYYIPHRIDEGYGLKSKQIFDIAIPGDFQLIITTDCGSSSHNAVNHANQKKIDVIITDHHKIPDTCPDALAVVNPRRNDCFSGSDYLAGVGVVFCLIISLRKRLRDIGFWETVPEPNLKEYCDLVALGTISDIVPIIHENRIITKAGLEVMNTNPRTGIKALIEGSGINKPMIETEDIAFKLGPRLNAAGRMEHAALAVDLLTTKDMGHARDIAQKINVMNSQRQSIERQIVQHILTYFTEEPNSLKKKSIVLGNFGWHEGVLGIVASKLVEKYYRPVVLISFNNGIGKGSARSIPGINLYEVLCECSDYLENFGGHPMAAGLEIMQDNMKPFQAEFEKIVHKVSKPEHFIQELPIDCELEFDMINDQLINELELLQPFGPENPEPVFSANNIQVTFSKIVGSSHLRLNLKQIHPKSDMTINGIWFNADKSAYNKKFFNAMAFKLRWNYWNGNKAIQAVIEDA